MMKKIQNLLMSFTAATVLCSGILTATPVFANDSIAFKDVDSQAWYANAVQKAVANHLIKGNDDQSFGPEDPISRAQFTVLMYNLLFQGTQLPTNCEFADVAGWAAPYVQFAKDKGIVHGVGGNLFAPDNNLTREQAAAIFINALKVKYQLGDLKQKNSSLSFSDTASIYDGFVENISESAQLGLILGVGQNRFDPKGGMTRAQAVTMVERFYENQETYANKLKNDYLPPNQTSIVVPTPLANNNNSTPTTGNAGANQQSTSSTPSGGGGGGGGGGAVTPPVSNKTAPVVNSASITMNDNGNQIVATMDQNNTITLSAPKTATVVSGSINVSEPCTLTITSPSLLAGKSQALNTGSNDLSIFTGTDLSLNGLNLVTHGKFNLSGQLKDLNGNVTSESIHFVISIQP